MIFTSDPDAVVIGSGPNGLAAAIALAQAGQSVILYEAGETAGGGMRTKELTLPGFRHDICSAIHPMGMASPFFRTLPLAAHGLEWIQPDYPLAHPFDDGTSAVLARSIEATAETLGRDGAVYRWLMSPLVHDWERIAFEILRPLHVIPRHPVALGRFGVFAGQPATILSSLLFRTDKARAFFAGLAGHSVLRMEALISSSFGLVLGALGHVVGWPLPKGGSQSLADALTRYFESLGGRVVLNHPVKSLSELPNAKAYVFNTSPRQMVKIVGDRFPSGYQQRLMKYRYAPGVFKVDWALDDAIPWENEACRKAGTIHLGGSLREIAVSERAAWRGEHAQQPYVLLAQQSLFDATRAPAGKHTAWAYCHVPNGSTTDMTEIIENQIERFAPGFKKLILKRHTMNAAAYEAYNPNYVGGDVNGGMQNLTQLFMRPTFALHAYHTPAKGIYLCSAATPPGGGVHGMAGYHAAQAILRQS